MKSSCMCGLACPASVFAVTCEVVRCMVPLLCCGMPSVTIGCANGRRLIALRSSAAMGDQSIAR